MSVRDNIKRLMSEAKITQGTLAEQSGVTQSMIALVLNGNRVGSLETITKLAKGLGVKPHELLDDKSDTHYVAPSATLPAALINWSNLKKCGKSFMINETETDIKISVPRKFGNDCFALSVRDDSMVGERGAITFLQGSYIAVDPKLKPKANDFVVFLLDNAEEDAECGFRQYVQDGGKYYLRPLNTQYEKIAVNKKVKILGVVVKSETFYL